MRMDDKVVLITSANKGVSSRAGRRRVPGLSANGASKSAVDFISNTVRKELAEENIADLFPDQGMFQEAFA